MSAMPFHNGSSLRAPTCFSVLTTTPLRKLNGLRTSDLPPLRPNNCRRSSVLRKQCAWRSVTRSCQSNSGEGASPSSSTHVPAPIGLPKDGDIQYRVHLLTSVTEIDASVWDSFATGGTASPFLLHDWIRCLEQSGSAAPNKGWSPSHIIVRATSGSQPESSLANDDSSIISIIPAYIKAHSMGEFVFDQEWADAAYAAGIMYYPKLLVAIPFTPATGRRILTHVSKTADERTHILSIVGQVLVQVCHRLGVSSAHVNFCNDDEVEALRTAGFLQRKGVQYHFTNVRKGQAAINAFEKAMNDTDGEMGAEKLKMEIGDGQERYRDFDDYLSEFKSKKRIKIRRERTVVRQESGLEMDIVQGPEQIDLKMLEQMYDIYKSTIDKLLFGRQYLSKQFFQMLDECTDFKKHICLVLARRQEDGKVIGGTFNIVGGRGLETERRGQIFYGRYWGCLEEYRYLHFEACYYAAIEYCIENGLEKMEPGAGGGEFKYLRGYEPCIVSSMHYVRDSRLASAIARYLNVEGVHVDGAVDDMKKHSAIRSKAANKQQSGDSSA